MALNTHLQVAAQPRKATQNPAWDGDDGHKEFLLQSLGSNPTMGGTTPQISTGLFVTELVQVTQQYGLDTSDQHDFICEFAQRAMVADEAKNAGVLSGQEDLKKAVLFIMSLVHAKAARRAVPALGR